MKKIPCPKCGEYITFDEKLYDKDQKLVFVCGSCHKQFVIRIGKTKLLEKEKAKELQRQREDAALGYVTVVENVFGYKQIFPLKEGDNVIGRKNAGTEVDIAIESSDRSMDRKHCVIRMSRSGGKLAYTLRDCNSLTGTFYMNEVLGPKEQVTLSEGDVITLGATTLIFHAGE